MEIAAPGYGKLAAYLDSFSACFRENQANCQFAIPFSGELMTRKWRVAILGLGHWYSAYNLARALQEYPKAELAAVAWHNSAQLAAFTNAFRVSGYPDYGELLKREEIDLVHI